MQIQDINPIEMLKQQTLQDAADAISETEMRSETEASLSRQGSLDLSFPDLAEVSLEKAKCTATHPEREGEDASSSSSSSSGTRVVAHSNSPLTTLGEGHEEGHKDGAEGGAEGGVSEGSSPPGLSPVAVSADRGPHGLGLGAHASASHPDSSPPRAPPSCMGQVIDRERYRSKARTVPNYLFIPWADGAVRDLARARARHGALHCAVLRADEPRPLLLLAAHAQLRLRRRQGPLHRDDQQGRRRARRLLGKRVLGIDRARLGLVSSARRSTVLVYYTRRLGRG